MTSIPHIPALRWGQPYESLDHVHVVDHRNGAHLAAISQLNAGIVRKDLQKAGSARAQLARYSTGQLVEISRKAAGLFLDATLPLGDSQQSPDTYIRQLSATSGLPHTLIRRNMAKIHDALTRIDTVLNGLTRGIDPGILDRGWGTQNGATLCFVPATHALGLVMPSNSPAVNSLWLPAIPLKIPAVIKPGRDEPWTPFRLIQAFIAAGAPPEAFSYCPTGHEGAAEILNGCGRSLLFGDRAITQQYASRPGIQLHGPGFSKILVAEDQIDQWPEFLDVMVQSIVENGGRSCVNASAIVVPRHAREIAAALGERLAQIHPLPPEHDQARLSAFANPKLAEAIDFSIQEGLAIAGATDVTASFRSGPRLTELDGALFLRPTLVHCDSFAHPLANREFLFPYASIVEVPQAGMMEQIGPSLAVTAITRDSGFIRTLLGARFIERLNIGPVSTLQISWDQPHEGNMFDFLYARRSIQFAPGISA